MNIEKLKNEWFPLLFEKELKNRPISKILLGQKLVILELKMKSYVLKIDAHIEMFLYQREKL